MSDEHQAERLPAETDVPDISETPEEHEPPRGTMLLMMLFLIMIVAMWGWVYLIMLQRG